MKITNKAVENRKMVSVFCREARMGGARVKFDGWLGAELALEGC